VLPFLLSMHPTYSLTLIKGLIRDNSWRVTIPALRGAGALGFDEDDICDCILNHLSETHFYKTMPAEKIKNCMLDVYYITYRGVRIYVKLQVRTNAVVISFKDAE
jgi:hypothetical protein